MNNILTGMKSIHCDTPQADYEQYTDRHEVYTLWHATGWLWTIYWPARSLYTVTRHRLTMNNILTGMKSIHCDTYTTWLTMNNILTGTKSIHCDTPQADYEQYTDRHEIYRLWARYLWNFTSSSYPNDHTRVCACMCVCMRTCVRECVRARARMCVLFFCLFFRVWRGRSGWNLCVLVGGGG